MKARCKICGEKKVDIPRSVYKVVKEVICIDCSRKEMKEEINWEEESALCQTCSNALGDKKPEDRCSHYNKKLIHVKRKKKCRYYGS